MPYIDFKGESIYYEMHGEGEPLLLLNGALMQVKSWEQYQMYFSRKYKLILLDFIGQGNSYSEDADYNINKQSEVIKELLDLLNLGKVHIFGTSYGATVGLNFAVKYQNYIKSIILQGAIARLDYRVKSIGDTWIDCAEQKNPHSLWQLMITQAYSADFYIENYDFICERERIITKKYDDNFFDSFIKIVKSIYTINIFEELHDIKIPVLLIASGKDWIMPTRYIEEIHLEISRSEFIILHDEGHCPYIENPTLFKTIVEGFIAKQS